MNHRTPSVRLATPTQFVMLALGLASAPAAGQASLEWTGYMPPNNNNVGPQAISGDGSTIVGWGQSATGQEAFRWTAQDGVVPLGYVPGGGAYSSAFAVSQDGSVIVGTALSPSGSLQAFRWTQAGGMVALGAHPTAPVSDPRSEGLAVSGDGSIVGGTGYQGGWENGLAWSAPTGWYGMPLTNDPWPYNAVGRVAAMSDDGTYMFGESWSQGIRWSGSGFIELGHIDAGGGAVIVNDVSPDGSVVVGNGVSSFSPHSEAFRWDAETGMVGLGDLDGGDNRSSALATNGDGSLIGGQGTTESGTEAFIWDPMNGMRHLETVLVEDYGIVIGGSGYFSKVTGISDDGTVITGNGSDQSGNPIQGFVITLTGAPCQADMNADGILDNGDIGAFITFFLTYDPSADMNADGILDNGDIGAFITAFLTGC